jgi:hypothetical protein
LPTIVLRVAVAAVDSEIDVLAERHPVAETDDVLIVYADFFWAAATSPFNERPNGNVVVPERAQVTFAGGVAAPAVPDVPARARKDMGTAAAAASVRHLRIMNCSLRSGTPGVGYDTGKRR